MSTTFPTLPWGPYTKAVQAYDNLVAERQQTSAAMLRMRGTLPDGTWADGEPRFADGELSQAIAEDDAAQARAMRSGDKDPGRKNTQRVAKALAEVTQRLRVLDQAMAQAEQAVYVLLAEHQGDVQAAVAQGRADAERRYQESLDALQDARDGYHRAARQRAWVSSPNQRFKEVSPPLNVPDMKRTNGDPFTLAPVIAALQAEITPPQKPRKALYYEQKPEKVIRGGMVSEIQFRAIPVYADEVEPKPARAGSAGLTAGGVPVYMGESDESDE